MKNGKFKTRKFLKVYNSHSVNISNHFNAYTME